MQKGDDKMNGKRKEKEPEMIVSMFLHVKTDNPSEAVNLANKIIEKAMEDKEIQKEKGKIIDLYALEEEDLVLINEKEEKKFDPMFV